MREADSPPIAVIVGPTAAGKSAIAMELARRSGRAIISADSRQIYRGFDIGTAKPTVEERAAVRHYGIDIVDPTERFSAHLWAEHAHVWLNEARKTGRGPLIVGGTGFYIRALVQPLADAPALDEERRKVLEQWLGVQELETLRRWCVRLDPLRAHLGRTQLLRAIETALLSGQRLGDAHAVQRDAAQRDAARDAKPGAVHYLLVDPGPTLAERIRSRVSAMVEQGWPAEVRDLMARVPEHAPGWLASGYSVMRQYVRGDQRRDEAIERIVIETRQYAKRQRTWFRHQLREGAITQISSTEPRAVDQALAWLAALERPSP